MFETVGTIVGVVGALTAVAGVVMALVLLARAQARSRALTEGQLAEAVCLDTYVTHSGGPAGPHISIRHKVLGFRTPDGQEVRVDDTSRTPRVVGDRVLVRYLPDRPHQAAVTDAGPAGVSMGVVIGLLACVLFGAVTAVMGFGFAATAREFPGPGTFQEQVQRF